MRQLILNLDCNILDYDFNFLQNIVEEKSKEIDKLTQINVQVQQSLKMEVDKSSNLVQAQNAAIESAKILQGKVDELQANLSKKVSH